MSHSKVTPRGTRLGIHRWFARMPGQLILDAELKILGEILPNLFGYHLLQVGNLGDSDLLSPSRILHRVIINIDDQPANHTYPYFSAAAHALPVASDSIDVVLLPHVLEFEANPHEALREADRVLVPEGHIVITGFSPWSWMGLWKAIPRRTPQAPWSGNFLGQSRVRDWLALLGFDITGVEYHFFRPPFGNEKLMERLNILERFGSLGGGVLAGSYVLTAKKRVSTLTSIRPRWAARKRLVSVGLAEPTGRVGDFAASDMTQPVEMTESTATIVNFAGGAKR